MSNTNLEKLPLSFDGGGEVKGYKFNQVQETENGYIYEVSSDGHTHYEIIKKVVVAKCLDFGKRIYSDTDFRETYPKANGFGIVAWTATTLEAAVARLSLLEDSLREAV